MISTLLQPFLCTARNHLFLRKRPRPRTVGLCCFGAALLIALYLVALKVVVYFHGQSELGVILSLKIYQMAWIVMFAMLVFSSMVSAVSTLYLSRDNEIIFSAPVTPGAIYAMRFVTTTAYTSWMMVLFSLPVFMAYGRIFQAGLLYYPLLFITLAAIALIANGFGMGITVILVRFFPARRTKDIVFYLSLCFGIFLYIMFRMLRPEELVNPESYGHFVEYLAALSRPTGPWVPGAWAANLLAGYLTDRVIDRLLFALLLTTPSSLFFLGQWAMEVFFLPGYSKSQESFGGSRRFRGKKEFQTGARQWIFRKELKTFLRDSAEWSQLFMIAALVVVYLYSFKALPLERSPLRKEYISNLISFLNIGLSGFIITSLSARFVYPSVGGESGAFAIIAASPLPMGRFLFYKFLFYAAPFTLLSLLLVTVSDYLLEISGPMWWFSLAAGVITTWMVVAMAIGFGSMFADFKAENRAAAQGSLGAIFFLFTAMALQMAIIAAGAEPLYWITRRWLVAGRLSFLDLGLLAGWFILAVLIAGGGALYCFKRGVRSLEGSVP